MNAPKVIVRSLSIAGQPQYVVDSEGLVVPGGGSGPYYLIRPKENVDLPLEVVVAVLSHPVIDAYVTQGAREYRGGYLTHDKQNLVRAPFPAIEPSVADALVELVIEMQELALDAQCESDEVRKRALVGRRAWLRRRVDEVVSECLGLDSSELAELR